MKINQIKIGSLLAYIQIAAGIVVGLVYTPVMIRLLGHSEYGLYNTAASIISMLSILNLGFSSGYIRFYSEYERDKRNQDISRLNGMFLLIFTIIGLIALFCGLVLSSHLELVFDSGLTAEEYDLARDLLILLTINLALSFPMSVFANIISAHEKFVFLKLMGLMKTVVSPLVTLPLLLMGYRSVAMVVVTICIALITDVTYVYYVLCVLRNKFVFKNLDFRLFRELFSYTGFIALNIIVDQINWNVDRVLLARYQGTFSVAVYSVGYTLFSYYMTFSTAVSGLFTARVHRIARSKTESGTKFRELTELFIKVGRVQFLILGLVASGLVIFGHTFIVGVWAGSGYSQSYYVMILLVLSSSIALIQNIGIEIQRALNKHRFRSMAYAFMALVNLMVSIILAPKYGAVGVTVGTAISLIVGNGLIMNIYYAKRCGIDILLFWKNILHMLRGTVAPIAAAVLMSMVWIDDTLVSWFAKIIVYSIVYCISMWYFAMNEYERNLCKKPVTFVINRLRKSK